MKLGKKKRDVRANCFAIPVLMFSLSSPSSLGKLESEAAATLSGCGRPIRLKTEDVFITTTVIIKVN